MSRDYESRNRDADGDRARGQYRGRDRDDDRGSDRRRGSDRDDDRSERRSRDRDDDRGGRSSGGRSRFQYHERSAADTKSRSEKGANDYDRIVSDSVKMWKPNDGVNRIRIIPPTWDDAKHFGYDIYVHYGVGPDRGQFLCLSKMKGEADPIEEERAEARRDGDEKYAKDLEAKRRVGVYLIDRDHEKEGVQFWAMPWTLDRDIVKVSIDRSSGEVLPIDHPDEGFDVEFEKKGSKDRTEYLGVAIARRSTPLGKDEWLDQAMEQPIPSILKFYSYDHIAKAFSGGGEHRDSRDRDDSRSRDRDDDRGRDRDDDRNERRSRDRDDDRGSDRRRESSKSQDQELSWEAIHDMTQDELEDLVDQKDLDINPAQADGVEDLADWICEELKIVKEPARRTRVSVPEPDRDEDTRASSRLRDMRNRRGD